ncbi:MAG: flavin reductase [Dehalococcoidia bacterium]|nr:flavin reductase [Dehalococcoidia bacterium]
MDLDPATLSPREAYQLLITSIVPRPIAFVSTISAQGVTNAAPFSFFTALNAQPALLAFSVISPGGEEKDTLRNVRATRDFVINIVSEDLADAMNTASGDFPADVSEIELTNLTAMPSVKVKAPWIAESPVSMECRLTQIIEISDSFVSIIMGEAVLFHVRDGIYNEGRLDETQVRAIGALGTNSYSRSGETFGLVRPSIRPPEPSR